MKLHVTTSGARPPRRALSLTPLLTVVMLSSALAQGASALHWSMPGDFDRDGQADTIIGVADLNGRIIPEKIAWGDAQATTLELPPWATRGATVWSPDGMSLVVALAGSSRSTARDTVAMVLVNSWGAIKPTRITIAESPAHERALMRGQDLVEPAVRDLSGRIGYRLDPAIPAQGSLPPLPARSAVELRAVPNPAGSKVRAELVHVGDAEYEVAMYDLDGRRLRQEFVRATQGKAHADFDVSILPAGHYFLRVLSGDDVIASASVTVIR